MLTDKPFLFNLTYGPPEETREISVAGYFDHQLHDRLNFELSDDALNLAVSLCIAASMLLLTDIVHRAVVRARPHSITHAVLYRSSLLSKSANVLQLCPAVFRRRRQRPPAATAAASKESALESAHYHPQNPYGQSGANNTNSNGAIGNHGAFADLAEPHSAASTVLSSMRLSSLAKGAHYSSSPSPQSPPLMPHLERPHCTRAAIVMSGVFLTCTHLLMIFLSTNQLSTARLDRSRMPAVGLHAARGRAPLVLEAPSVACTATAITERPGFVSHASVALCRETRVFPKFLDASQFPWHLAPPSDAGGGGNSGGAAGAGPTASPGPGPGTTQYFEIELNWVRKSLGVAVTSARFFADVQFLSEVNTASGTSFVVHSALSGPAVQAALLDALAARNLSVPTDAGRASTLRADVAGVPTPSWRLKVGVLVPVSDGSAGGPAVPRNVRDVALVGPSFDQVYLNASSGNSVPPFFAAWTRYLLAVAMTPFDFAAAGPAIEQAPDPASGQVRRLQDFDEPLVSHVRPWLNLAGAIALASALAVVWLAIVAVVRWEAGVEYSRSWNEKFERITGTKDFVTVLRSNVSME